MIDVTIRQTRMAALQTARRGAEAARSFALANSAARVGLWWMARRVAPQPWAWHNRANAR